MEISQVPPMFFAAFGGAFFAVLVFLSCMFVLTRRMGMMWKSAGSTRSLDNSDVARLGRIMWGREAPPVGSKGLVIISRAAFAAGVLLLVIAVIVMAGAAQ